MMEERKFYVYVHRRKSDNQPFYVGKGYGRRAYETSEKRRSKHWVNVARKHGVYVEMYRTDLTEAEAFALEKSVIARLREENCPLVNVADGGQGGAGIKMTEEKKALLRSILLGHKFNLGRKWSEEAKQRMSVAQKKRYADGCKPSFTGREHTEMTKELIASKLRGRQFSEETKAKMRAARIGKTMPEETKAKLKEKNSGKNSAMYGVRGSDHPAYGLTGAKNTMSKAVRCVETGQIFESISLAARHFRQNGYPKASHQPIASSIGKPNRTAYGYTWEYV